MTLMYFYATHNMSILVGLAAPEPMSSMYDPTYFRATWVMTALDAGFWTAMPIRSRWARNVASVAFSMYYLVAAERADEKVRKVRGMLTVEHLRVSWNKPTTPLLSFAQGLVRPRFTRWPPRAMRIPRPGVSNYTESVAAWLYYDGPVADLQKHKNIVLDISGGGYVAMNPRCHDDKLLAWAARTGLPVLSLDYKKAPEHPYPFAINECFDVYMTIANTKGKCVGLSGTEVPRVIITGDSAGGNLATAMTLMIVEHNANEHRNPKTPDLPVPEGLLLFYPSLDMNIGNWMTDEQMSLIRDRRERTTNKPIVRRKSMQYTDLVGTPHHSAHPSDDEDDPPSTTLTVPSTSRLPHPEFSHGAPNRLAAPHPQPLHTRLATSSMISYFNDRILSPEMMRAMIILYIGPHARPDFSTEYLLSPVLAPDALLERFPKTYFLTGERDPLVDDTVIFAGRLRRAREGRWRRERLERLGSGDGGDGDEEGGFDDREFVNVTLIPGISHGFLQFPSLYPPGWKLIDRCAMWIEEVVAAADVRGPVRVSRPSRTHHDNQSRGHGSSTPSIKRTVTGERRADKEEKARKASLTTEGQSPAERERRRVRKAAGRRGGVASLKRLGSTDDLLGRRMMGLAGGLTGLGEGEG